MWIFVLSSFFFRYICVLYILMIYIYILFGYQKDILMQSSFLKIHEWTSKRVCSYNFLHYIDRILYLSF